MQETVFFDLSGVPFESAIVIWLILSYNVF